MLMASDLLMEELLRGDLTRGARAARLRKASLRARVTSRTVPSRRTRRNYRRFMNDISIPRRATIDGGGREGGRDPHH